MVSRWKIAVFSILCLASCGAFAYLQVDSTSHQTDVATLARPGLEVHLWVSSPKAEVSLNVSVTAQSGRKEAAVYVQTNPVTDVLVAVPKPVPHFDSSFKKLDTFVPLPDDNDPIPPPPQHYYELTKAAQIPDNKDALGYLLGEFPLSSGSLSWSSEVLTAQLPPIAEGEMGDQRYPEFGIDTNTVYSYFDLRYPDTYRTLFYEPSNLQTSERLSPIEEWLSHSDIQINQPETGTLENGAFVWRGTNGLAPVLRLVDRGAAEQRSRDEFLSGIALATAAATLVALIQEFPGKRSPEPDKAKADQVDHGAGLITPSGSAHGGQAAGSPPPYPRWRWTAGFMAGAALALTYAAVRQGRRH